MAAIPFAVIYLIPAIFSAGLAVLMWQHRYYRGGRPFTLLLAAIAWWNTCHALSIIDTTFEGTLFWSLIQNVGIVMIGPCWLLIALAYSGEWWRVPRWLRRGIFVPELIALVLALTNNLHYLWWSTVNADTSRPFLWLSVTRGPAFWFHSIYAYTCLVIGIIVLGRSSWQAPPIHRYHARLMLVAALIPAIGNIAFLSGLQVPWNDDPTPVLLFISAALGIYTTMRYRLFDLAPLAEQEVIAGLPDGLIVLDSRGLVAEINQHAPSLLGINTDRWIGRALTELVASSPFGRALQQHLATPITAPTRPIILNNGTQAIEVRFRPLQSAAGITTGSLMLIRDISERFQAEQERLRHIDALTLINAIARSTSTARETRSLFNTIAHLIVQNGQWERVTIGLLDETQSAIIVAVDYTAHRSGELQGTVISNEAADSILKWFKTETDQPILIQPAKLAADNPYTASLRQEGWQLLLLAPLRHEQQIIGFLGLATSTSQTIPATITKLVTAIAELITDAIVRIRLYEQLQRADRLKTGLLATVSHELRTPLTSIIGYIDMLRRGILGELSPDVQEALGYMRQASLNLMRLINDILEFSHMEAGQLTMELEAVDANKIIQNVGMQMRPQALEHNLTLMINPLPNAPRIIANEGRLEQVLINLISNAIKFNRPGGLVDISIEPRGEWLRIKVSDTGIGIPPEDQERIFEEFQRVQSPNGKMVQGIGLGLAICRRLITHMGGKIGVESVPGEGSTFFCDLPVAATSRMVGKRADA
ncbi:MAG: PAS domain-containing protein [Chloroflexus sp.]